MFGKIKELMEAKAKAEEMKKRLESQLVTGESYNGEVVVTAVVKVARVGRDPPGQDEGLPVLCPLEMGARDDGSGSPCDCRVRVRR